VAIGQNADFGRGRHKPDHQHGRSRQRACSHHRHKAESNLETPSLRVDGDRLLIRNEECAASGEYKSYDNDYKWKVSGKTLEITPVTNHYSDRVALTILTSQTWTKTG